MYTAVGHGLVDPGRQGVFPDSQALLRIFKANGVNIVQQDVDNMQWRKGIRECRWELREAHCLFSVSNLSH